MTTLLAAAGPLLVALTVKVTVAPTSGVTLSTALVTPMSVLTAIEAWAGGDCTACPIGVVPFARAVLTMRPAAFAWARFTV